MLEKHLMSELNDNKLDTAENSTNDVIKNNHQSLYSSFSHASKKLAGLVAIDYFFANEISQCVPLAMQDEQQSLDQSLFAQYFHLLIVLSASLRDGHSCLPLTEVANKRFFTERERQAVNNDNSQGFLFADLSTLQALLQQLPLADSDRQPIVLNKKRLYLRRYYQFEQELKQAIDARRTVSKDASETLNDPQQIKSIIEKLFPDAMSNLAENEIDWQALAVANAINKDFAIIAGGPGTGKTYTVTKLLAALIMLSLGSDNKNSLQSTSQDEPLSTPRISLVAPTGKAAQRLCESITNAVQGFRGSIDDNVLDLIPSQAQTLHRLLGVIPEQVNFRHHQDNLLSVDILLIDEVSMVDLPMMTRVFRALPPHTKVILLGDADQLPSVAVGNVLADFAPRPHLGFSEHNHQYLTQVTGFKTLAKHNGDNKSIERYSPYDCVTFLMKSRRFDGQGGIGKIANYVIKGQYRESWQLLQASDEAQGKIDNYADSNSCNSYIDNSHQDKQLTLLTGDTQSWLTPLVSQYYNALCQCDNVSDAFALLAKFRILSSTRKGPQGVENLNALVIDILRHQGVIPFSPFENNRSLYPTQPIMISENDYRLGVYNGDTGLLWRNKAGHLMAVFENISGEYDWIMPSRLPKFETVYAMTIHKTQGSEFEHVAMVLPDQKDNKLLSRELLYTGITRAKSQLSIASSQAIWQSGVSQQVVRYSGLSNTIT